MLMEVAMFRWYALAIAALVLVQSPAWALPSPLDTLQDAYDVMDELEDIPSKGIPPKLLSEAQAIAIIPRVVKAGFIIGGRGGHGVVLTKDANGQWGNPTFVNLGGASFGFQAGVQSTDVVLLFRHKKTLERVLEGRRKITLGADASIAAGPVGRQAEAGTDLRLQSEILSYSRSRGLFAGVALDGAMIGHDERANSAYDRYQSPELKRALSDLQKKITSMSGTPDNGPQTIPPIGNDPSKPAPKPSNDLPK